MARAMNFTAWCLGSDEMNNNSVPGRWFFQFVRIWRGRVLLDCEATDTVGSVEAIEGCYSQITRSIWNMS